MTRRTAALILAITLNPALLVAQDTVLTVNVPSADVYKGPTIVTPVIGHVPRGTVLPISRNLGSWVKIAWPDASDGVGYVHVTMGRLGPSSGDAPARSVSPRAASAPAPVTTTIPLKGRTSVGEQVVPRGQLNGTPASHIFGVGGLLGSIGSLGSMSNFGATVRAWRNNRLGIQFGLTRDTMPAGAGRQTAIQLEPGVVFSLFDRVGDYLWIRPYVGSTLTVRRQTFSVPGLGLEPTVDNGVGFRVFGGSELTFASIPRFGLSADLGYRRFPTPFPGFEANPLSVSIAGHWYVK
jgi:hypothetical protein